MLSERLAAVIKRELQLESLEVTDTTTADQIAGWDSLAHVKIIMAIEEEFGIRLRGVEIIRLRTIMDLQRLVDSKLSN